MLPEDGAEALIKFDMKFGQGQALSLRYDMKYNLIVSVNLQYSFSAGASPRPTLRFRTSAKVGSDSEPSRGRLQPSRRAERDFCGKGGVA